MKKDGLTRSISRRETLKVCLVPAGVVAARWLGGCSDNGAQSKAMSPDGAGGSSVAMNASTPMNAAGAGGSSQQHGSDSGGQPSTGTGGNRSHTSSDAGTHSNADAGGSTPSSGGAGGNSSQTSTDAGSVAGPGVPWATGGTKAMQGGYPDPFAMDAGTDCVLYPAQTIGPCYADGPAMRQDISDGLDGLPLRLSLLLVHSNGCMPVPDASIDVWHSGSAGIYSAFAMGTICNPGTDDVVSQMFCRGVQTTDANGRVDFNTVFPGWYTGRALHIHFTVRVGGQEYVTSQLYFEDALTDEIQSQGIYKARGMRDTTNAADFIFSSGGGTPDQVLLSTAKRPDGVLHAWKVLSIT